MTFDQDAKSISIKSLPTLAGAETSVSNDTVKRCLMTVVEAEKWCL